LVRLMTPEERIKYLESFLDLDPNDSFTHFAIAQEHQKLGDMKKVAEIYEGILETNPSYVGVYLHLGKLYQSGDRVDDARSIFEKGIEIASSQKDLHSKSELQSALMDLDIGFD